MKTFENLLKEKLRRWKEEKTIKSQTIESMNTRRAINKEKRAGTKVF